MKKRWILAALGVAVMMNLAACGASGDVPEEDSGVTFSFESISFELPDGWEEDESLREDNAMVFAPEGDAEAAGGYFSVRYFKAAFGWVDEWLTDTEERAHALEETGSISACTIEDMGTTFMGRTARVKMVSDREDKPTPYVDEGYYAEDEKGLYIFVMSYPLEEDAAADSAIVGQVRAAGDMFWKTGRIIP